MTEETLDFAFYIFFRDSVETWLYLDLSYLFFYLLDLFN